MAGSFWVWIPSIQKRLMTFSGLSPPSPNRCYGSLVAWLARIDANRFARIAWFARIGNSSGSCESAWRAIKIGVAIANDSANKGLPLPLGRGVCETKSKNGRPRPRKPFIFRAFCPQRGVWDHGLRPWSWKGPDHGVGVDPETVNDSRESIRANRVANRPCH